MKVKYAHQKQYPIGYQSDGAAGIDLRAIDIGLPYADGHSYRIKVSTDTAVEIPKGYFGLLCLRSSLGKKGVRLSNTVGVIDSDFRGEIVLELVIASPNHKTFFDKFDRIAQLVLIPVIQPTLEFVEELSETERGSGGFGSTGSK